MKKPIDPNLERFEDSVFSLTGGDDTSGEVTARLNLK